MTIKSKKILIIFIYLAILVLAGFIFYSLFSPEESCFDEKQNQNERGVDCGGVCSACEENIEVKDLVIEDKRIVFGGGGTYDAVLKVRNPNDSLGAKSISYKIVLKNKDNIEISSKTVKGFILPLETKYMIALGLESQENPAFIDVSVERSDWQRFTNNQKPQLRIFDKKFNLIEDQIGSEAYGVVRNESDFEFGDIKINVILRGLDGAPVGASTTQIQTLRPQEERGFKVNWPYKLQGDVVGVDMEAEADIYNSENFTKSYIQGESVYPR